MVFFYGLELDFGVGCLCCVEDMSNKRFMVGVGDSVDEFWVVRFVFCFEGWGFFEDFLFGYGFFDGGFVLVVFDWVVFEDFVGGWFEVVGEGLEGGLELVLEIS